MCLKKKRGDSASPLFKIGCFLCYQKKVGNSAVTYFIGNIVGFGMVEIGMVMLHKKENMNLKFQVVQGVQMKMLLII